jgi:hypothetical protein
MSEFVMRKSGKLMATFRCEVTLDREGIVAAVAHEIGLFGDRDRWSRSAVISAVRGVVRDYGNNWGFEIEPDEETRASEIVDEHFPELRHG